MGQEGTGSSDKFTSFPVKQLQWHCQRRSALEELRCVGRMSAFFHVALGSPLDGAQRGPWCWHRSVMSVGRGKNNVFRSMCKVTNGHVCSFLKAPPVRTLFGSGNAAVLPGSWWIYQSLYLLPPSEQPLVCVITVSLNTALRGTLFSSFWEVYITSTFPFRWCVLSHAPGRRPKVPRSKGDGFIFP